MDVFTLLLGVIIIVCSAGLILSLRIRSKQKGEIDTGVDAKVKTNPILLNPILLSYVLVTAVVVAAVWIFKLYYKVPF
ncbi:hypothetical protein [Ammoniphilus sp. CFH 90114]|uniref:hypothetical protein n=1 Tax=Ammoniphilus sp. CFH 90114 TaxID=2493665 RepID=UPI00100E6228|nr:hypothetical protein [Ammoniphilus sp. CFH 90114]RXT04180.1 hypothetical protein EIZ39_21640 [Ammoniphilus sp. CFH 90114]